MGNSPGKLEGVSECITDEKWSKQLESYLGIEDVDIEADLIYHFDGKSSSGNCSSLPVYRFSSTNHASHTLMLLSITFSASNQMNRSPQYMMQLIKLSVALFSHLKCFLGRMILL